MFYVTLPMLPLLKEAFYVSTYMPNYVIFLHKINEYESVRACSKYGRNQKHAQNFNTKS